MIKYALIAKGSLIIADYTDLEGDFEGAAKKILAKNGGASNKK